MIYLMQEETLRESEDSLQRKLLTSKLKSLNDHLAALIQKKIRLDLEIKATRKKLSKVKTMSQTEVKTRLSLEGLSYEDFSPSDVRILSERAGQEIYSELLNLDKEVYKAEELLETYKDLPLYRD